MRWNSKVGLLALGSFFIAVIVEQLNERWLGFAQLYQDMGAAGLTWTLTLGSLGVCLLVAFPWLLTRLQRGWIAPLLIFVSFKTFEWFLQSGVFPEIPRRDIEWILQLLYGLFFATLIGLFAPLLYLFTVEKLRPRQARLIQKPNAHTVVVFVHGLGGDLDATWGKFPSLLQSDSDLAAVAIFLWGYPTGFFRHVPGIWEAAKQLQTEIRIRLSNYKNVVLVGHSLGGLVIRATLIDALKNGRGDDIKTVKHIVTFGTPNDGSQLASIARAFGLANRQLADLGVTSDSVTELRNEWVNRVYAPNIERGQELTKRKIPLTAVVGVEDTIVTPDSARSFFQNPPPESVPGDHRSMTLPQSSEDTCYMLVKKVLSSLDYPAERIQKPMPTLSKVRVFVSHSSRDKSFVRKLVVELEKHELNVWFDELEIKVGDSIVSKISEGLKDTDYLIAVLSQASVSSPWVQQELNSVLMGQSSGKRGIVLPVLVEDCEIPQLLKDRLYADFRHDFEAGLQQLLAVFEQEGESTLDVTPEATTKAVAPCSKQLSAITLADLRRRISKRMNRSEVSGLWFDVLETAMEDDMTGRELSDCVINLLDKAKKRNKLSLVIEQICQDRPDLADP